MADRVIGLAKGTRLSIERTRWVMPRSVVDRQLRSMRVISSGNLWIFLGGNGWKNDFFSTLRATGAKCAEVDGKA